MNREIYKRVAPHLDRIKQDGGTTTSNMNDLLLLQRSNEQYKDYLKLSFCPELHGYKKDTRSNVDYITKGYSANSIQQELGPNLILNSGFDTDTVWIKQTGWSINNGVTIRTSDNNAGWIYQNVLIPGKLYKASFTITSYSSGRVCIGAGGSRGTYRNSIGTYTEFIYCITAGFAGLVCENNDNFVGSIDNVTFQEVLSNDLTQTSSANQPYLDKIAPAEKLCAKNPNGGDNYLTHPTISFGATDEWSCEFTINWFSDATQPVSQFIAESDGTYAYYIALHEAGLFKVILGGQTLAFSLDFKKYAGKSTVITVVSKNGRILLYVNGIFISSQYGNGNNIFKFYGVLNVNNSGRLFRGNCYSHHIFSKALSASEVAERSAILRSIFPEIPFARIGDQIWSVRNFEAAVTPQGNLIPEMKANGNVEKMINTGILGTTDFMDSDSNGLADSMNTWNSATMSIVTGNGFTGNAQRAVLTGSWGGMVLSFSVKSNIRYKVSFKYRSSNAIVFGRGDGSNEGLFYNAPANTGNAIEVSFYTPYLTQSPVVGCFGFGAWIEIDNVSIQEIGWSGSQELYDGIYAQTAEAASSVEKVINGGFDTNSNWNTGGGWTISGGVANGNGVTSYLSQTMLTVGKYYKVTFTVLNYSSGHVNIDPITFDNPIIRTSNGTYTVYGLAKSNVLWIYGNSANLSIDNVSVKELGLSDTTSIANYTYAAVKAAAMWCHYGNDPALGAVYGKLYNWFAVKLLQMDIDYYNANNPTTPWGWSTPLQSQNTTLAANGGNVLKVVGNTYWTNSNGTNQTGMSLVGTGYRQANGTFTDNKNKTGIMCYDSKVVRVANDGDNTFNELIITTEGFPIRLIKV